VYLTALLKVPAAPRAGPRVPCAVVAGYWCKCHC
jgi:hypothetical protein